MSDQTQTREEIYADITEALGQVPGFFQAIPDASLQGEWSLFKHFELGETSLDPMTRELIGTAVAAAMRCWYCAKVHGGLAAFHGATEEQVQEAVHLAKFAAGWSTYLNGITYDQNKFLDELGEVGAYLTKKHKA
jgi:AhpD family alkylhydroperoxidase